MAQQLANLQSDVRVSYGNDALMPDQELGDGLTDFLSQEETLGGVGFVHPESFNQGTKRPTPSLQRNEAQRPLIQSFLCSPVELMDARPNLDRGVPTRPGKFRCFCLP